VTGSAKGIGAGVAVGLAHAGYRVAVNYRKDAAAAKRTARECGGETLVVGADVTKEPERLVGAVMKAWGRVDVLVNNVGDFFATPAGRLELERWEALYESNVRSALRCTREVLPVMRRQKHGVIVNIGGTATSSLRGNRAYTAYVMAKAALAVFTKSLAQAEAAGGIRVNMVNPGYIRTYAYSEAEVAELAPQVPAKRLGTPADVAAVVRFLAGDDASYVTGASIDVGGGLWV
jgi:3-oxoacyl-[acyl-carrier protein] reductase